MKLDALPILHYVHDPLCGWCYAAQPLVSAALTRLGERMRLQLHGGGLFAEPRSVDAALAQHIAASDRRIAQYSGQPFGQAYLAGLHAEPPLVLHSLPPIAAVLAAETLDPAQGYPMLTAIQDAHYRRGLRVTEASVLAELAEQIGLDAARFEQAFNQASGTALVEHMQRSRRLLDDAGGEGFPTLLLERDGRRIPLDHARHYGRPEAFVEALAAALPALH